MKISGIQILMELMKFIDERQGLFLYLRIISDDKVLEAYATGHSSPFR